MVIAEKDQKFMKQAAVYFRSAINPKNMPLRVLHFTLQRALGFQESHSYEFIYIAAAASRNG